MAPEMRVLVTAYSSPSEEQLDGSLVHPNADEQIDGSFVHLRHPKSGTKACYLLINGTLQELNWFKPRYSSWFIGDSVCEDGSLYLGSVVDPLFMVLPLLEESRMTKKADEGGLFRTLEDMIYVENFPCYSRIIPLLPGTLDAICDSRELQETRYYRLNDNKVLGWLSCKVEQTSEALKLHGFQGLEDHELKIYSIGLLGEYVKSEPWLQRLCNHFSVDLEACSKSKKASMPGSVVPSQPFRAKQSSTSSNKKTKKVPAASAGTSKITSFFARPR
ncbi:ribonuclease H2 subunit B isoform X2 [Selaginella moellendorffii]|uniref:ribonuclease H2 subunit B isoform X2 n=1 Tax=Selaginella moellendorffii TaxID=88036 RepID=UPI000D1C9617|nr:ribonuclease H2 subunit B isoform X2 [Selaginella moellendorffii]|eukprot:XP_024539062.1 ribonuclease H2 subunit B isoform X2 [Selaginella moellendorffii]